MCVCIYYDMCIHTCRNVLIFRRGEELDHAIKQVNVQVFKHYTLMNHSLSKIPRTMVFSGYTYAPRALIFPADLISYVTNEFLVPQCSLYENVHLCVCVYGCVCAGEDAGNTKRQCGSQYVYMHARTHARTHTHTHTHTHTKTEAKIRKHTESRIHSDERMHRTQTDARSRVARDICHRETRSPRARKTLLNQQTRPY